MSFLYPLGLWGLVGIPILIIIYIIKSKYTEQTVASTYLWTLSERFLKRRRRPSRLSGIISLILQILAVTLISLLIARPIITVPDSANDYCFILDGTGSMQMNADLPDEEGKTITRFEAAKAEITRRIDRAVDGSRFTLVCIGDASGSGTSVIFDSVEDKEQAYVLLSELEPAYRTFETDEAMKIAQTYFNERAHMVTCFLTDKTYESVENMEVLNVAAPVENYAISEVTHELRGEVLTVSGNVISYTSAATLTVDLCINNSETPAVSTTVEVTAGEKTPFAISVQGVKSFSTLTVQLHGAAPDALALDDRIILYNLKGSDDYRVLLVSERPFFLESALRAKLVGASVDVIDPADYKEETGYGLYVFDSVDSTKMTGLPTDGTVWLVNVAGSIEGSGYTVQGAVTLDEPGTLTHTTSSSSMARKLTAGLKKNNVVLTRYIKCALYRNFTTLLDYNGYPVVFAGTGAAGNREVVIAFDLHDSNLPLLFDYSALMRNLVDYSFPDTVDATSFVCGETADINVLPGCESIRVVSPTGKVDYLDTSRAVGSVLLSEVGLYTVDMTVAGNVRRVNLWSALAEEERVPVQTAASIGLVGEASPGGFDGQYDPLMILFIALAVVFIADWMVYCYEKYQLR